MNRDIITAALEEMNGDIIAVLENWLRLDATREWQAMYLRKKGFVVILRQGGIITGASTTQQGLLEAILEALPK